MASDKDLTKHPAGDAAATGTDTGTKAHKTAEETAHDKMVHEAHHIDNLIANNKVDKTIDALDDIKAKTQKSLELPKGAQGDVMTPGVIHQINVDHKVSQKVAIDMKPVNEIKGDDKKAHDARQALIDKQLQDQDDRMHLLGTHKEKDGHKYLVFADYNVKSDNHTVYMQDSTGFHKATVAKDKLNSDESRFVIDTTDKGLAKAKDGTVIKDWAKLKDVEPDKVAKKDNFITSIGNDKVNCKITYDAGVDKDHKSIHDVTINDHAGKTLKLTPIAGATPISDSGKSYQIMRNEGTTEHYAVRVDNAKAEVSYGALPKDDDTKLPALTHFTADKQVGTTTAKDGTTALTSVYGAHGGWNSIGKDGSPAQLDSHVTSSLKVSLPDGKTTLDLNAADHTSNKGYYKDASGKMYNASLAGESLTLNNEASGLTGTTPATESWVIKPDVAYHKNEVTNRVTDWWIGDKHWEQREEHDASGRSTYDYFNSDSNQYANIDANGVLTLIQNKDSKKGS